MKKSLILFISILTLLSCGSENKIEQEISKIPVALSVIRFEQEFAASNASDLPRLKKEFPMFFSARTPDSIWLNRMQEDLQQEVTQEISKKFPDAAMLTDEVGPLIQHIKYYFPRTKTPTIITLNNDVDYANSVIVADTLLLLSLDNFLGADHHFYTDMTKFISANFRPEQLLPSIASKYATKFVAPPSKGEFIEQLIYEGKKLYLQDIWLPELEDSEKIGYTQQQLDWAYTNEEQVWRYFVEKEVLFSTDAKLVPRFIALAPFSKFYLELDNQSPGMIGRFVGWQIVRSFMEKNDVTPQQLMVYDARALYNASKYKPKK
jgi:gliding motility-associated lipoprotein GldB